MVAIHKIVLKQLSLSYIEIFFHNFLRNRIMEEKCLHVSINLLMDSSVRPESLNTSAIINEDQSCSTETTNEIKNGTTIYLETPIIEENTISMNSHDYENAKPKRLSDEFLSSSSSEDYDDEKSSSSNTNGCTSTSTETVATNKGSNVPNESVSRTGTGTTERNHLDNDESLKLMDDNLNNVEIVGDNVDNAEDAENNNDDVQSMDAIERRDFEHEQRLTGGKIMKLSSLVDSSNCLKINLLNNKDTTSSTTTNNEQHEKEKKRNISSDSKCTYKSVDLSSTPTSSRHHSSRLTKSTAKINLSSSLSFSAIGREVNGNDDCNSTATTSSNVSAQNLVGESSNSSTSPDKLNTQKQRSKSPLLDIFGGASNSSSSSSASATSSNDSVIVPEKTCSTSENRILPVASTSRENEAEDEVDGEAPSNLFAPVSTAKVRSIDVRRFCLDNIAQADVDPIAEVEPIVDNFENESDQLQQPPLPIFALENEFRGDDIEDEESNAWPGSLAVDLSQDEEVCTCKNDNDDLSFENEEKDGNVGDLSLIIQAVSIYEENMLKVDSTPTATLQRKRKLTDTGGCGDGNEPGSGGSICGSPFGDRKRMAYDISSTPRSSTALQTCSPSTPYGRRTPRSVIPSKDNPPPELQNWLIQYQQWSNAERLMAVDRLIELSEPTQVRHILKVIEPQFQRDFISLLPKELALQVLSYLEPSDLLKAAQTCSSWRFLCDDNLLWKEKCRKAQILINPKTDRPKRGRAGNMPAISSPWKAAYMRQHIIESNWRSRPIRDPKVLKGHDDHVITCLQFGGNRIVSGSDDNTLKVWSAVTGRCLRTLVGHTGGVWSSQMSGDIIISGSTDRTLKVWDMETGICIHTLLGHTSTVRCMHLHDKKVVSGSRDATLRVWDIEKGICLHILVGHLAAVRCVQYDGKLIVSGAYDYMVKIWHPERQECLHTLQGHTNRVYSLQFDGIHVVSGSLDTSIRVWEAETGNCKHTLMGHQSLTSGMELRQNILVSGNADSTVKVWDITSGQCLQTLSGPNKHLSAVTCLQFNSRFVITSSDDGTVKLWDVKTGEFIRNLVALDSGGSGGVVWRIRANDTKLICAVGSRNGTEETKLMVLDFDVEGACVKCS